MGAVAHLAVAAALLVVLLTPNVLAAAALDPVYMTYADSNGINWSAQPPELMVDITKSDYTHIGACFYLPSLSSVYDFATVLGDPSPAGSYFVNRTHAAGKKVLLVTGGATELPVDPSYFTKNDPTKLANTLADIVVNANLDGVDIDYEDDYSNQNPGLTGYSSNRVCGSGPAIDWLITLTQVLRQRLPKSKGYIITHAPQPAYFALGYTKVYEAVKDDIDWFNVQYYNQGAGTYDNYTTIFEKEAIYPPASCQIPWNGAVKDIVSSGIPASSIVIGKPITQADANSGYIPVDDLAAIMQKGKAAFPDLRGMMGWEYGGDLDGSWIHTIKEAMEQA